ncbi:hypothetical protein CSC34_2329 [Pseudomonas aeruginosa]|nr:hypothetical protein CSC34_2329 [Pseudomonas aeruginosa]
MVFLNPSVPAQSRCRPCGSPSPRRERGGDCVALPWLRSRPGCGCASR